MNLDLDDLVTRAKGAEKEARSKVEARTGRARQAAPIPAGQKPADLAVAPTLKRAIQRLTHSGRAGEGFAIETEDLCRKRRFRPCDRLVVLLVDSSDSMGEGAEARMRACKGAVLALLRNAYQNRSQLALLAFGGEEARVVLPPTRSIDLARRLLERLPIGGATPFADGLYKAWQLVRQQRLKHPGLRSVLVIVSDGEANVPMRPGAPVMQELLALAAQVGREKTPSVLLDVVAEPGKSAVLRRLAGLLGAAYVRVYELKPRHIIEALGLKADGGLPMYR